MGTPSRKRKNPLRPHEGIDRRSPRTPHSSVWFAAMLATNTRQALLTGAVVERTGRLDVCSVCGATAAPIYDGLEDPFLPIRLCDDCHGIQVAMGARLTRRGQ